MNKKTLIYKSNKLVEASYRLDLTEKRIILYAIAQYHLQNSPNWTNHECLINLKEFAEMFGRDTHNLYPQLKKWTTNLYRRELTLYEVDEATGIPITNKTRWVIAEKTNISKGFLKIVFNPELVPHFHNLKDCYTRIPIENMAKLNTEYAIRLYELLKQQEDFGRRTIYVAQLRQLFELADYEYKQFNDLKRWVVQSSINQINKHTDLEVSFTTMKEGRTVTAFKFKVLHKDGQKPIKRKPRQTAMRFTQSSIADSNTPTSASHKPAKPIVEGKRNPQLIKQLLGKE